MIYKFLIILLVFILILSISFCEDKKKVLIIYDVLTRIGEDYSLGKMLEKYLSHYNVEVGSVSSNIISNVEKYDLIIYLGLEEKFLKKSFLKEISKARKIIWIEANIYDYVKYIGCKDFKGEGKQLGFTSLIYKNREIPFEPENSVYIIKPQKGKILSYISDGINKYPWVVNIDNLYYFGRLDFRDNTGIIFLDLLHEILEVKHKNSKKAMIILDDISPLTSAEFLEEKLKTYCCQGVPYLLVVYPTVKKDGKIFYLWDNEKLLSLLRKVEESGGLIVQGSFYENDYNSRINNDLNLLASCELYPVAFKMYDIPYKEKRVDAGKYFKIILDDSLILTKDLYTLIYPVNLGKYNPRDPKNKIEVFKKAKEFLAFRDIIIGISIPSYVSSNDIEELISNLKDLGYDFLDFSQEPYQVANENLIITNKNGKKWVVSKISPYSKTAIEKFFDRFITYLRIFLIVVITSFLLIIVLLINNKRKLYERELKK